MPEIALFSRPVVRKTQLNCEKSHRDVFPDRDYSSSFLLSRARTPDRQIGHAPDITYLPTHEACFSTIPSDRHRDNMDNNSSDGRGYGVEYTQQVGAPVAGEGQMPEMSGFRGTTTTSSAPPRRICDGVQVCPQPGNKRVAVGAPDAQRGGGNAWQPQHFNAVADAMGSDGCVSPRARAVSALRHRSCQEPNS